MKRYVAGLLILTMAALTLLTGCAGNQPGGDTGPTDESKTLSASVGGAEAADSRPVTNVPDTLTVAGTGEPVSLDPQNQNDFSSCVNVLQIYDTLVRRDNDKQEYVPMLATEWEYIDDCTVRFKLRDDVYYHDGSKFTANDVKFTFMRGKICILKAYAFEPFDCDATSVVDEYTIDIVTKEPFPAILDYLAGNPMCMVSEAAVAAAASLDEYARNPVGTGPWIFKEWIAGDRIVYQRNDNYWGPKAAFSTMIMRNISDDTTRAMSLEAGEVDVSLNVAVNQLENFENNPDVDLIPVLAYTTHYIGFNVKQPHLDDVRVRKALRYALDLESITDIAYNGTGLLSDGHYAKSMSLYSPPTAETTYEYNVEKAQELLKEAGFEDGLEINLWVNENQTRIDLAEMLQNAWSKIGVKTNVEVLEFGAYLSKIQGGEHDLFILGHVPGGDDGSFSHTWLGTSDNYYSNVFGYSNSEYDRLTALAQKELDPDVRNEYYRQVQEIVRADMPLIPLRTGEVIFGMRSTLTGFDKDPQSMPRLWLIQPK